MASQEVKMNERLLNEFASYYKRIIRVERFLKDLIYKKYLLFHKDNAYRIVYNTYFKNLRAHQNSKDKTFQKIYKDKNKTNNKKFETSVDKMYISEVLSFFSHRVFLKNTARKGFFAEGAKTNSNDFRKIAKNLKDFRNCICHFDTKQFQIDKTKFMCALLYFEKIINYKYRFSSGSVEVLLHNPSITSILKYIHDAHPEYFDDDRILVNVFDDIARLIDFRSDNLPQYKSIIRQKFKTEGKK